MGEAPYTVHQLAEHWQVTDEAVRGAIARGELTAYKVGKSWRIYPKDFEAYLKRVSTADRVQRSEQVSGNWSAHEGILTGQAAVDAWREKGARAFR